MHPKVEDVEFSGHALYYWVNKTTWAGLRKTLFDLD